MLDLILGLMRKLNWPTVLLFPESRQWRLPTANLLGSKTECRRRRQGGQGNVPSLTWLPAPSLILYKPHFYITGTVGPGWKRQKLWHHTICTLPLRGQSGLERIGTPAFLQYGDARHQRALFSVWTHVPASRKDSFNHVIFTKSEFGQYNDLTRNTGTNCKNWKGPYIFTGSGILPFPLP